jgi:hypothetical protein
MRHVIDIMATRLRYFSLKFIDLFEDYEDDYEELNSGEVLNLEDLVRVAGKHGLTGSCFCAEIKVHGAIGHFINIQRSVPEVWHFDGTREWRDESDERNLQVWRLDDFQVHCHCEQTLERLRDGTVRFLMGKTTHIKTLFGSPLVSFKGIPPPLPALRELRVRTNWEESREVWKFAIYHHGKSCTPLHCILIFTRA